MNNRDMMYEREIDLKDMLCYILLKWKSIIVCVILGAIIMCAYHYIEGEPVVSSNTTLITAATKTDATAAAVGDELVEAIASQIIANNAYVAWQQDYLEGDPFLRNDISDVYRIRMDYSVVCKKSVSDNTQRIVDAYKYGLTSDDAYEKYATIMGASDASYAGTYVKISDYKPVVSREDKSLSVSSFGDGEMISGNTQAINDTQIIVVPQVTSDDESDEDYTGFSVTIAAENAKIGEEIANEVDVLVADMIVSISSEICENEVSLSNKRCYTEHTDQYLKKKADIRKIISNTLTENDTIQKNLTDEQKAYVKSLVAGGDGTTGEAGALSEIPDASVDNAPVVVHSISVKWLLLGAIIGLFLACAFHGMIYIFSGKLYTMSEAEGIVRSSVYMTDNYITNGRNPYENMINKWRYGGCHAVNDKNISEIVKTEINLKGCKSVAVVTSLTDSEALRRMEALMPDGCSYTCVGDAATGVAAISAYAEADAIIIYEQLSESRYNDVIAEIRTIKSKEMAPMMCILG